MQERPQEIPLRHLQGVPLDVPPHSSRFPQLVYGHSSASWHPSPISSFLLSSFSESCFCSPLSSLQLVYDHIERQLADSAPDDASATLRRLEDSLLRGGSTSSAEDCPTQLQRSIEGLHAANIIAIRCWPERRLALTGSSDGTVTLLGYDGALHRSIAASSSGVLCLALRPGSNGGGGSSSSSASASRGGASGSADAPSIAAAGCMDGSVVLLDVDSGAVLATARPHRKYCVR